MSKLRGACWGFGRAPARVFGQDQRRLAARTSEVDSEKEAGRHGGRYPALHRDYVLPCIEENFSLSVFRPAGGQAGGQPSSRPGACGCGRARAAPGRGSTPGIAAAKLCAGSSQPWCGLPPSVDSRFLFYCLCLIVDVTVVV